MAVLSETGPGPGGTEAREGPRGAAPLIACLSEPRAARLAQRFALAGHACLRLQLQVLQAGVLDAPTALRLAHLHPAHEVLLPVSPGAVEMIFESMRWHAPEGGLADKAWLCVGPGTEEEILHQDPRARTHQPRTGTRDLASLLAQADVQDWIGTRHVHLLCAKARAVELGRSLPAWVRDRSSVHPVYTESWQPLHGSALEGLLQHYPQDGGASEGTARAGTPTTPDGTPTSPDGTPTMRDGTPTMRNGTPTMRDGPVWLVGSRALVERLGAEFQRLRADPRQAASIDAVVAGFCSSPLICPHPRIAEAARALGHAGPVELAAGVAEIEGALARIDASWSSRSPPPQAEPPVPAVRACPSPLERA